MFQFDAQDALARASGTSAEDPSMELAQLAADAELPLEELRRRAYGAGAGRGGGSGAGDAGFDYFEEAFSSDYVGSENDDEEGGGGDERRRDGKGRSEIADKGHRTENPFGRGMGLEALLKGGRMDKDAVDARHEVRRYQVMKQL